MSETGAPASNTPSADPAGQDDVVQAVVRADGTAEVALEGVTQHVETSSVAEAGAAIMGLIAEVAARTGRSVPVQVRDPDGLWSLLVHPDGSVEEASAALAESRGRRSQDDGADDTRQFPAVPSTTAGSTTAPAGGRTSGSRVAAPATGALPTLDDLLSSRRRPVSGYADRGWRKRIRRVTGGVVSPGPGRSEAAYRDKVARIQRNFDGPKTIVVVNPKGGAHKTTATLLLAATFGIHRGGYTLAWDNNETRGTLGWRSKHAQHANTAVNLAQDLARFSDLRTARVGDLDDYVRSQASAQFDVLASDEDAASAASIDAAAFMALHRTLSRFYRVIVVDTGNNMRASNWQAAVSVADQLVIVSTVREDTAQSAAWAIDALRSAGYADLLRSAVTVLSAPEPKVDKQLRKRLHEHFGALTRAVLDVPHDRRLIHGGPIEFATLAPATRAAWLDVTATVADGL
ncbi:chromosome partitioning protein [Cellulomonas sp. WB94]|uniref:MinD/ParA family ATP-binding protein n=1 Tax=Cellulomonas sp. WB94 TaxID=2173174 RepID=UPI0018D59AC0|nr:chromosome partitioning protein [Cellulomonas sp. WB94]